MADILLLAKGTGGDLAPFPRIGAELSRRGHRIVLLSHYPYAGLARQMGWEFVALDSEEERRQMLEAGHLLNNPAGYALYFKRYMLPKIADEYRLIRENHRPGHTIIVTNHKASLVPLLAREHLDIPLVRLFATVSELITLPLMEDMYRTVLGQEVNQARKVIGLEPVTDWTAWMRRVDQEVALWPAWFAAPETDWPVPAVPAGFVREDGGQIPEQANRLLAGKPAPLLITAGTGLFTDARFYSTAAEACGLLGRAALLVTRHTQLVPDALPERVKHFDALPFADVMPRTGLVIHHGGVGTLACAMGAGIPQLILAAGGDRPDNGLRVRRLGVGDFLLPPRWQAQTIADKLAHLLDSAEVRLCCAEFSQDLRQNDAAGTVSDLIERQVPKTAAGPAKHAEDAPQPRAAQRLRNLSPEKQALLAKKILEAHGSTRPTSSLVGQPREPGINTFPLSFGQQRLWFLDRLASGEAGNNLFSAVRLHGPLAIAALEYAFQEVVRRHESLRTVFQERDGQPIQVIAPQPGMRLRVMDLSRLPSDQQETEIRRLAQLERRLPFDLAEGPLLRCTLLHLAEREHVLLLAMDHIISDGWSTGVLFRELAILSQSHAKGLPNPLPPLPIQFADFAVWQRNQLQGENLAEQVRYWKDQLQAAPPVLDLRTDYPRPAIQTHRGRARTFECSPELTRRLRALCQKEHVTLFMALLTAFQILLARFTGQDEILVGSPHANRSRRELEGLIGLFANTLVLRGDLSGDPSFHQALARVREAVLGAHAHQDLPFEKLVDELHVDRDLSRNPLFQVMFTFQTTPREVVDLGGLTLEALDEEHANAQLDMTLEIVETRHKLKGRLTYNLDLFEPAHMLTFVEGFQVLLEAVLADTDQPISRLPIISGRRRKRILSQGNNMGRAYPRRHCIHQLFERQVRRSPEAVAAIFGEETLSYGQLNQRANQVAHYLRGLGVGPDILVGICVERSLDMLVGVLGVLKAGGAYVPLDPGYPAERLAFMLEDSRLSLVLTQRHLAAGLPGHGARQVCIDSDWPAIAREKNSNPRGLTDPFSLAYVIYTSGSTGRPKGVQVTHQGVVNFLTSMQQAPGISAKDRLLSVTTLSFDIAGLELYLPLITGAQVEILPQSSAADGYGLREHIKHTGATVMQATPATWRLLLEAGWQETGLKVLCGGEAMPPALADSLLAHSSSLWNLYGPTETTIWSTLAQVQTVTGRANSSIGRPIANTQVFILDRQFNPVPSGVPGELFIGGDGLARGYLNRPGLTAEKFIPNPFDRRGGSRLYRTGDLARWRPDGQIEYLGRLDHQVKLRGFRIELGEIEIALSRHPAIQQAVALVREDRPGDRRLVAYILLRAGMASSAGELRGALKSDLPDYMMPSAFVFLESLPHTPNGKLDRKALPPPEQLPNPAESSYAAPRNPFEERLALAWAQILGVPRVGIHDNFFALGGDSMLSMRVIARARKVGVDLNPKQMIQYQTIAELAAVAGQQPGAMADQGLVSGALPAIANLMLNYVHGNPQAWWKILEMMVEVPASLDAEKLSRVVRRLTEHHDGLRLRVTLTGHAEQMQIVERDESIFLATDLSGLPAEEQDRALSLAPAEHWGALNISTGPLLRVVLFDLGPGRPPRVLLILHHFAADAYALGVLLADFQTACRQVLAGIEIVLPAKTSSLKQWAERMQAYVRSDEAKAEIAYWKNLPWSKIRALPADHPEVERSSYAHVRGSLNADETRRLLKIPAAYEAEFLDVLLAACVLAFARYVNTQPVLIMVIHHGRNSPLFEDMDLSRTVGSVHTYYPVLLDLDPGSPATDIEAALRAVVEQKRQVPNSDVTWPWLSYYYPEPVTAWSNTHGKYNVVLNYLGQTLPESRPTETLFRQVERSPEPAAVPEFDVDGRPAFDCSAAIEDGQFRVLWKYYSGVHDQATAERVSAEFLSVLREIIAHAERHSQAESGASSPQLLEETADGGG